MNFIHKINYQEKIFDSIGEAWIAILKEILNSGCSSNEYLELNNSIINFRSKAEDKILCKYGNESNIKEMKKVFFSDAENMFGHSYKKLMLGPKCRTDFSDIIEILTEKNTSNRAIISFMNTVEKQPCISSIHFKIRNGILNVTYFSRGQDIYNKFYCDAVCIDQIAASISTQLNITNYFITGFMSSAHIYMQDIPKATKLLASVEKCVF